MATSPGIMAAARNRGQQFETKLVMRTFPYAIGIRKGEPALKARLDAWVHDNLRNGEIDAIDRRYNGASIPDDMLK